jgi:flagellar FliL protein
MPPAVAAAADATPAKPTDAKPADAKPPKKPRAPLTKKKLLVFILGGVLLLAAIGGGGFVVLMKKRAVAAQIDGADAGHAAARDAHGAAPIYVPLDAFTVNLADNDAERFAQVAVTFEVEDDKAVEQVKSYLPSIRNAILLILTRKTSAGLLGGEGKEQLAREIARGAARAMGYDVPPADAASAAARVESFGPIRHVHFANFIIQ